MSGACLAGLCTAAWFLYSISQARLAFLHFAQKTVKPQWQLYAAVWPLCDCICSFCLHTAKGLVLSLDLDLVSFQSFYVPVVLLLECSIGLAHVQAV